MDKRLVIGVSGASGAPLAVELLKQLGRAWPDVETHLILTRGGEATLLQETGLTAAQLGELATVVEDNSNIGAAPASGSWKSMGMIVCPCSMKTVAGIASGYSENLLLRAADCMLKERRKLVLVARESPLSTLHLENLAKVSRYGAVVLPPMQTYYNHPPTVQDMTRHTVNRILSQFDLEESLYEWKGLQECAALH